MYIVTTCPICGTAKTKRYTSNNDVDLFDCARCGKFRASWELLNDFKDIERRLGEIGYVLSGLARELSESDAEPPVFLYGKIDETLKNSLIPDLGSIEEKVKKFINHIRRKTEYYGQTIKLGDIETAVSLAYAKNSGELLALFSLMREKKLADVRINEIEAERIVNVKLLSSGWNISKKSDTQESNRGFIAVWFEDTMNESIQTIERAISESGFRPICIKNEIFPETIMEKALGEIKKSRFVVVDLTGQRVDVSFEAGFAHGLGVETIYVYDRRKHPDGIPRGFYTRHFQCHGYDSADELLDIVKSAISARIK